MESHEGLTHAAQYRKYSGYVSSPLLSENNNIDATSKPPPHQMIHWLSNLSDTEKWALGFVALLLIGIFTQWFSQRLGHQLTVLRDRRSGLREIAIAYRADFAKEVADIKHGTATMDTLIDGYAKHRAAVTTSLPLLGKRDRARVQQAWDDYRGISDGLEEVGDKIVIVGYNHPEFSKKGRQRFHALSSCLDHLAT